MRSITEKTLIPISALSIIIGGVIWLTTLQLDTKANAASLSDMKDQQKMTDHDLSVIKGSLIRIEEQMKILVRSRSRGE